MRGFRRQCADRKYDISVKFKITPAAGEAELWERLWLLKASHGLKFRRQQVMLGWIVDFWLPSRRLIIEIDGGYHATPKQGISERFKDMVLTRRMRSQILRFTVDQVLTDMDGTIAAIIDAALARPIIPTWNKGLPRTRKRY